MRVGLIGYLSSFVALRLGYIFYTGRRGYLTGNNNLEAKESFHQAKNLDWNNWLDQLSTDDSVLDNQQKYRVVDLKKVLIGYVTTYLVVKILTKATRSLILLSLIMILICKLVMATGIMSQLLPRIDNYFQISLFIKLIKDSWKHHKPFIGDYIETYVFDVVNAPIPTLFVSSILGIISYFIIG